MGEEFVRLSDGNVSEFQKKKASGALPTEIPTMDEKDDTHWKWNRCWELQGIGPEGKN